MHFTVEEGVAIWGLDIPVKIAFTVAVVAFFSLLAAAVVTQANNQ